AGVPRNRPIDIIRCSQFSSGILPRWLAGRTPPKCDNEKTQMKSQIRTTDSRRALVLVNPKARRGQEAISPILDRLKAGGLSVTIETFEALPELARDIVRLRNSADLVVICRGD